MKRFTNVVRATTNVCMVVGAIFLILLMALTMVAVVGRALGHTIPASYELSELIVIVTVVFALSYAALHKMHVTVQLVVSRFSQRVQTTLEIFTSALSIGTWALMAWGTVDALSNRWLLERTDLLEIPVLPIRFVWVFGLALLCILYLIELSGALGKVIRK